MFLFNDLATLIAQYESLDKFGTLYVDLNEWSERPEATKFLLLVGDDELEELDDDHNPVLATERNMRYFSDVEIFQSIIYLQIEKERESKLSDFVRAINHYLECDDF